MATSLYLLVEDNKGTRLTAKSSTLEAIGVLLPFLAFPERLSGKHIILQVDNTAVIYGWKKRHISNDVEASVISRKIRILSSFLSPHDSLSKIVNSISNSGRSPL